MAKVYVVGPYIPNGGTFMAYHVALILHRDFGFQGVAVQVGTEGPDNGVFDYPTVFPSVALETLPSTVTDDDVLIVNPSFSAHCLALRCRGRKVMYVQDFKTFDLLDCRFDLYVSVSGFVQGFLRNVYGIETPVISPFIRRERFPEAPPWSARPAGSVLLHNKGNATRQSHLLERVRTRLRRQRPDFSFVNALPGKHAQGALIERLGQVRYLFSLCPAEGFGLIPLEAMAMGTTVIGFDAFGGRDYMRPDENCAAVAWPRVDELTDLLLDLLDQPERAAALAAEGRVTARLPQFGIDQFDAAWRGQFASFLGRDARSAN